MLGYDSIVIGGLIAQIAFWVLLVAGYAAGTLGRRGVAIFVLLWAGGYVALPRIAWWTGSFITPWIAALDIALVFIVRQP